MRRTWFLLPLSIALAQAPPGWKEFSIGPPTQGPTVFSPRSSLRAASISLRRAVSFAWEIDESRIAGPAWIAERRYSIRAVISGGPEAFRRLFRQELVKRFHIETHWEERDTEVYVLRRGPHVRLPVHQANSEPRGSTAAGRVLIVNGAVSDMARQLSVMLKRPVIDETASDGKNYDIHLNWEGNDPSTIALVLRDELGLELTDANRQVEFLVIDRIEQLN